MTKIVAQDHTIRWPSGLLVTELENLIQKRVPNWDNYAETLLADAFSEGTLLESFKSIYQPQSFNIFEGGLSAQDKVKIQTEQIAFLTAIQNLAHQFPSSAKLPILYSERKTTHSRNKSGYSLDSLVLALNETLNSLRERGYFEKVFGADCPDGDIFASPLRDIANKHEVPGLTWPLDSRYFKSFGIDFLFDVLELLDYYAAAPINRYWHHFGDSHWDYSGFSRSRGQTVYRWEINRLLKYSQFPYAMAINGESAGQIVESIAEEMTGLIAHALEESDIDDNRGAVEHAVALFQKRDLNSIENKRSACVSLARVLEHRRGLLKKELLAKDEGALFQIANQFQIRHHNSNQQKNYDPAFLEWIFWWYLATIDLTNKIISRQTSEAPAPLPKTPDHEPPF